MNNPDNLVIEAMLLVILGHALPELALLVADRHQRPKVRVNENEYLGEKSVQQHADNALDEER